MMKPITPHNQHKNNSNVEICNECGRNVTFGSGLFVNRVVDLNDEATREDMGKPFPVGDYICIICDDKIRNMTV